MTPDEIPAEVVAAALRADHEEGVRDGRSYHQVPDHQVRRLIAGAVAAERERAEDEHAEYLSRLTQEMDATLRAERDRIIALAERCYATCQDQNGDSMPFADAIREQP